MELCLKKKHSLFILLKKQELHYIYKTLSWYTICLMMR